VGIEGVGDAVEQILLSLLVTLAAMLTGQYYRWQRRQRQARETARLVEAERIIALLSGTQPGVWDQDELRARVESTARELWSLPTREDLARLSQWVQPAVLAPITADWPARAARREVRLRFQEPAAFVQVHEGGEQDRVVARLRAQWEATWLDATGREVKRERRAAFRSYHSWVHIDGLGWQLTAVSAEPPLEEPPPSSVSCRILPGEPVEQSP
jgi:hypothetical protein